jgi:hypothetical protein
MCLAGPLSSEDEKHIVVLRVLNVAPTKCMQPTGSAPVLPRQSPVGLALNCLRP